MYAPQLVFLFCVFAILIPNCSASAQDTVNHDIETKKIELFDGVSVKIPRGNDTSKLLSFEIATGNGAVEGNLYFIIFHSSNSRCANKKKSLRFVEAPVKQMF